MRHRLFVLLLLIFFLIFLGTVVGQTYCNGNYTSGNWVINSTISCDNEVIPINGNLSIMDDSEYGVLQFNSSINSNYNLSGNSTSITAAIPDLDRTTPSQYTLDWDPNNNHAFLIAMNETSNIIQIFTNHSGGGDKLYGFDLDASGSGGVSLGSIIGIDFVVGNLASNGGKSIGCFNESAGGNGVTYFSGTSGEITCGNVTGWNSGYNGNFTVYWNNSGNAFETVIDRTGSWVNISTYAGNTAANHAYTIFRNSRVTTNAIGNLSLTNITLSIGGNISVDSNAIFTVKNSNITFQLIGNGSANMTWHSDSIININNSIITSNQTSPVLYWGWRIATSNYNITNNNISYGGFGDSTPHSNNFVASNGGLIYKNNFSNCNPVTAQCILVTGTATGLNISSNTFDNSTSNAIGLTNGNGINIENNILNSKVAFGDYSTSNTMTNINVTNNTFLNSRGAGLQLEEPDGTRSPSGIIIKNNNFSFGEELGSGRKAIQDNNISSTNTLIYSNSLGEIKWENKNNLTVFSSINIDNKIFIEYNNIGLANNPNISNLNTSAQIIFYGLTYSSTPFLLRNGARCDNTNECNISSYSDGTLIVNISHFSNYTTQGASTAATSSSSSSPSDKGGSSRILAKATNIVDKVKTGEDVKFSYDKNGIPILKIEFKTKNDLNNVKIEIEAMEKDDILQKTSSDLLDKTGKVYKYLHVNKNNLKNSDLIGEASIKFRVSKEWLSENNVMEEDIVLFKFDKGWKKLETSLIESDQKNSYYKTRTPGFSYFAIGEIHEENVNLVEESVNDTEEPVSNLGVVSEARFLWIIGILILIIICFILHEFQWHTENKK